MRAGELRGGSPEAARPPVKVRAIDGLRRQHELPTTCVRAQK